jgi:hypothetical protein
MLSSIHNQSLSPKFGSTDKKIGAALTGTALAGAGAVLAGLGTIPTMMGVWEATITPSSSVNETIQDSAALITGGFGAGIAGGAMMAAGTSMASGRRRTVNSWVREATSLAMLTTGMGINGASTLPVGFGTISTGVGTVHHDQRLVIEGRNLLAKGAVPAVAGLGLTLAGYTGLESSKRRK